MSFVEARDGAEIFYRDLGRGQPLVFHHGWPLTADDWDAQLAYFLSLPRSGACGVRPDARTVSLV